MLRIAICDDMHDFLASAGSLVSAWKKYPEDVILELFSDGDSLIDAHIKNPFDIILLDPPYAEVFLENALKCITEIDILRSGGIIVCERPAEKELPWLFEGYTRSKDYKYGRSLITLYRKD